MTARKRALDEDRSLTFAAPIRAPNVREGLRKEPNHSVRAPGPRTSMVRLILIFILGMGGMWCAQAGAAEIDEYQVKAAFLFNFAKFVEWPAQAFKSAGSPIEICVLSPNPFGFSLANAVEGKVVGNRQFVVRDVRDAQQANGCHILFVSAAGWTRSQARLGDIQKCCVLTVGEEESFIAGGGMIDLKLVDARVRVEINPDVAERARLRISSKLLSLAEIRRK